MTMPIDPDDVIDDRLRNAFRAADDSAPPDLTPRVNRLIRRQRTLASLGVGVTAAAIVTAGGVAWQTWPRLIKQPLTRQVEPAPAPLPAELFTGPPVDSFKMVTHQQEAYLTALQGLTER